MHADCQLPAKADVVVVGGGIIDASAAFFSQSGDSPLRWSKRAMSAADDQAATGVGAANRTGMSASCRDGKNGVIQPASSTSIRRCLAPEKRITQFRQTAADGSAGSIQSMMVRPSLPSPPTIANGAGRFRATIHQECAARGLDLANGAVARGDHREGPRPDTSSAPAVPGRPCFAASTEFSFRRRVCARQHFVRGQQRIWARRSKRYGNVMLDRSVPASLALRDGLAYLPHRDPLRSALRQEGVLIHWIRSLRPERLPSVREFAKRE